MSEELPLKQIHESILKILGVFDEACKAHQIEYVLGYGSALGAIRHQGFIPWDDDLDIIVDYENYLKLVEYLPDALPKGFSCSSFEVDPKYNITLPAMKVYSNRSFIKERTVLLKNHGENTDGIFIDIFIFDHIAEKKWIHKLNHIRTLMWMPVINLFEMVHINPIWLKKHYRKIAVKYHKRHRQSPYVFQDISWTYDGLKDRRVLYTDMFPPVEAMFEGKLYPVPRNAHAFLSVMYGENYMTPIRQASHIKEVVTEDEMNDH